MGIYGCCLKHEDVWNCLIKGDYPVFRDGRVGVPRRTKNKVKNRPISKAHKSVLEKEEPFKKLNYAYCSCKIVIVINIFVFHLISCIHHNG